MTAIVRRSTSIYYYYYNQSFADSFVVHFDRIFHALFCANKKPE